MIRRAATASLTLLVTTLLVPPPAKACATCFGAADDAMTVGMNNGILTLLVVILVVQIGFVALFVSVWRRARRLKEQRGRFHLIEGGVR